MSIKDQIKSSDGFTFGLWNECPDDAPVAWGARAISDSGCGFSLLHDRQSWAGPKDLIDAFSKVLNQGPIKHAVEVAKRLRDGWTPYKELSDAAFKKYWRNRMKEDPHLFESWEASGGSNSLLQPGDRRGPMRPHYETPKDADPLRILHACQREAQIVEIYNKRYEHGEVDEDDDEEWEQPRAPVIDAYQKIVGRQDARMFTDESGLFTLYDDNSIVIKANTNASHGHFYLIAYPKHDAVDLKSALHSSEKPEFNGEPMDGVFWSGPIPVPEVGDTVNITSPVIGRALVIGYRVWHNYLHLLTVPEGELPDWWAKQNKDVFIPPSETWTVAGAEISKEEIEVAS